MGSRDLIDFFLGLDLAHVLNPSANTLCLFTQQYYWKRPKTP
jgi:hypothetical protein